MSNFRFRSNKAPMIQPLNLSECWIRAGKFPFRVLAIAASPYKVGDVVPGTDGIYSVIWEIGDVITIKGFCDEYRMQAAGYAVESKTQRWLLLLE